MANGGALRKFAYTHAIPNDGTQPAIHRVVFRNWLDRIIIHHGRFQWRSDGTVRLIVESEFTGAFLIYFLKSIAVHCHFNAVQ